MDIEILGAELPGRSWNGHENVHVGIQRGREVIDIVPGDGVRPRWLVPIGTRGLSNGTDFAGPFVHGTRGARFLYLSWGEVAPDGSFAMFSRAKIMLDTIPGEMLQAASNSELRLVATIPLTDPNGDPVCAALRPPRITWSLEPV